MIDAPRVGMVVKVDRHECCGGHRDGTEGTITHVNFPNSFEVTATKPTTPRGLWHCTKCVTELAEKEAHADHLDSFHEAEKEAQR